MRCLLIYRININETAHTGVLNKMHQQTRALQSLGNQVSVVNHDHDHIYLNEKILDSYSIKNKRQRYHFNFRYFFKALRNKLKFRDYDLIYIRYPFSSPSFLRFCKKVKKENPRIKIVLEMPTFPYGDEFSGLLRAYLPVDSFYRSRLKSYVDFMVHFGSEKSLLGIPCINTTNGIDFSKIPLQKPLPKKDTIRLIGVSKWFYWHGMDRVLEGMHQYAMNGGKRKITLTLVGEGPELQKLKDLVKSYSFQKQVRFVGVKKGESLHEIFDEADVGIGTLGIHRKNLKYNASLKHREYCARGLPFVLSTEDEAFSEDCGFVSYVPANDQAVPMEAVIELSEKSISGKEIRAYGESKFKWSKIMRDILARL